MIRSGDFDVDFAAAVPTGSVDVLEEGIEDLERLGRREMREKERQNANSVAASFFVAVVGGIEELQLKKRNKVFDNGRLRRHDHISHIHDGV